MGLISAKVLVITGHNFIAFKSMILCQNQGYILLSLRGGIIEEPALVSNDLEKVMERYGQYHRVHTLPNLAFVLIGLIWGKSEGDIWASS